MKVLFLDQTGELGGGELSLLALVQHLPCQSTVLLFQNGPLKPLLEQAGIAVEIVETARAAIAVGRGEGLGNSLKSVPAVLGLVWQVARRCRDHDIIYANSQKALVVGALASALTRRPLVWHLRDILDAAHFSDTMRRVAVRMANWQARQVIVNSKATGAAFIRLGGDSRRVSLAYSGVDDTPFSALLTDQIAAIRAELEPGPRRLIGVFGRLAAWKGQSVFIEAMAQFPDALGIIVGAPLFGEEAYAAELERKVEALGLRDRIRFLGFRRDIPALMQAMDVIVHSSIAPEPFGRVVVEAMLAGKPVVASAAGGVLEIIEHGKTGWLYEPGDARALATALRDVLTDQARAGQIAAAGRDHAQRTFTIAATVAQVESALRLASSRKA
jgi:glycosyltransferase involved in cell wall biosynthesis